MIGPLKLTGLLTQVVGTVGSLFVKRTTDGKYEVALAPIMVAAALGSTVVCALQNDEPFRQCVKSTVAMLKEITYAN